MRNVSKPSTNEVTFQSQASNWHNPKTNYYALLKQIKKDFSTEKQTLQFLI